MNSKSLLAVAAIAAFAATGASADEVDASQFVIQFDGSRTRAEVMAEASKVAANRNLETYGSRVTPALQSALDRKVVRAQAAEAVRLGQIPSGDVGHI